MMHAPPSLRPAVRHAPPAATPRPDYYVPLPRPLLLALRDTPLAIGVYALIGRITQATRQAIPLSAGDVARYDPSISRHAADRALDRLIAAGYVEVRRAPGRRSVYLPTWGRVRGEMCRWDMDATRLGCPRTITWVHLPQQLLDVYLGRLEPDALRGAHITRYVTQPLLSLVDVGAYAMALAGVARGTDALVQHGLLRDGLPQPPPPLTTVLTEASQRRLLDGESPIALTPAGWQQLGVEVEPRVMHAPGQPLVFVPTELRACISGTRGGNLSGSTPDSQATFSASPRPRGRIVPVQNPAHGSEGSDGTEPTTHAPTSVPGGGTNRSPDQEVPTRTAHTLPPSPGPETTEGQLFQLGVRRDIARQLADRPLAQVERVIAQARARQGVRDLAAWVVSALRALPAVETRTPPAPAVSETAILFHPTLTGSERQRWLTRFRKAHPADRPAVLARFHAEHPQENPHAHAA